MVAFQISSEWILDVLPHLKKEAEKDPEGFIEVRFELIPKDSDQKLPNSAYWTSDVN